MRSSIHCSARRMALARMLCDPYFSHNFKHVIGRRKKLRQLKNAFVVRKMPVDLPGTKQFVQIETRPAPAAADSSPARSTAE